MNDRSDRDPLCERGLVGYTSSMRHAPLLLVALSLLACETKSSATKLDAKPTEAKSEAQPAEAKTAEPSTKPAEHQQPIGPIIEHTVKLLDGTDKSLVDYRGKTLLVVNTASECGFTPQYAELQKLYADYKDKGLEVLAFPSNDFGEQEPGTPEQIRAFVDGEYHVEFTMFDKLVTTGPDKSPLYKTLTEDTAEGIAGDIKWNFTKFVIDPTGRVVARFEPAVSPSDPKLISAIEHALPPG